MKNFSRIFWGNVLLLLAVAFGLWLAKYGVKVSDRYAKHVGVVVITTADATPLACPAPVVDVTSKDSSARCNMECEVAGNKVTCEPKYQPDWCVIDANSKACACQTDKESDACTGKDSRPLCEREPGNLDCVCANVDKARTKECLCRDPKSQPDICKEEKPPVTIKCGTGQKLVKDKCVDQPLTCAADKELVQGKCVPKEITCGEGKKLIKNACVADEVEITQAPEVVVDTCARGQIYLLDLNADGRMIRGYISGTGLTKAPVKKATKYGDFVKLVLEVDQCDLSKLAKFDLLIDHGFSEAWCSEVKEACQGVEYSLLGPDGKEYGKGEAAELPIVEVKDMEGDSRKLLSLGKEKSKP